MTRLATTVIRFARIDDEPVAWRIDDGLVAYDRAVADMECRATEIARGTAPELVWLVEHPPLLTAGTSVGDLELSAARHPVHRTGRGGKLTYHGPGQRVAYVMLDLSRRRRDVRAFVAALEAWLIDTLAIFAIDGERREDRVGVWVSRHDKPRALDGRPAEDKIAAIGIRLRQWVSFHGVSLNVRPDLSHYDGIVPCGIAEAHLGVTSLADLGRAATMSEVDAALRTAFERVFGPTCGPSTSRSCRAADPGPALAGDPGAARSPS